MIELPEIFKNDTQGNTTHLVPLIIINDRLYLSTQKTKLDGKVYSPFLKKLGNISEGVDINDRKYKVSNSRITFYNYTYNNAKLIDVIMQEETFNTPIEIYYKSQNAKSLDDCLRVYSGYIKNIEERKDDIEIESEDKTEQVLGKEIPQRFTPSSENLPEKHRNAPIPIVYGSVDRCPLVYKLSEGQSTTLISDDFYLNTIEDFLIYTNETYLSINAEPSLWEQQIPNTLYEYSMSNQYEITDDNEIIIDKTMNLNDPVIEGSTATYTSQSSPIRYNFVEATYLSDLRFIDGHFKVTEMRSEEGVTHHYVAPINLYEGVNNNSISKNLYEGFLDVRNYTNLPNSIADGEYWFQGADAFFFPNPEGVTGAVEYYANWTINLEGDKMPSESDIVVDLKTTLLETSHDDYTEPKEILSCKSRIYTNMVAELDKDYRDYVNDVLDAWDLWFRKDPRLTFSWGDYHNIPFWDFNEPNTIFTEGGSVFAMIDENYLPDALNQHYASLKQDITSSNFNISTLHYEPDYGRFYGNWGTGSLKWLKINNLKVEKIVILKGFDKYDLYASVIGRLDNEGLRYTTSLTTLTTEGRAVRPTRDMPSTPTAPTRVTKPRRTQKAIKKQVKTTSKSGY